MSYNYIFPTCVWSDEQLDLSKQILPVANEYLQQHGTLFSSNPNHISTYRNNDAKQIMQRDDRFLPLISYLRNTAEQYFKTQNVHFHQEMKDRLDLRESYSFLINKISKGASHGMHAHPSSLLSGCFYLQCSDQDPPIVFGDPRNYPKFINYEQKVYNDQNICSLSSDFIIPVNTGLFLMWPSWLEHTVPESLSLTDRITIAFNIG